MDRAARKAVLAGGNGPRTRDLALVLVVALAAGCALARPPPARGPDESPCAPPGVSAEVLASPVVYAGAAVLAIEGGGFVAAVQTVQTWRGRQFLALWLFGRLALFKWGDGAAWRDLGLFAASDGSLLLRRSAGTLCDWKETREGRA